MNFVYVLETILYTPMNTRSCIRYLIVLSLCVHFDVRNGPFSVVHGYLVKGHLHSTYSTIV